MPTSEQDKIILHSIPIGSLFNGPEPEAGEMYEAIDSLPVRVRKILADPQTGAFIRGLAKNNGLNERRAAPIAFNIMRVSLGRKAVAQLPALLSTEVALSSEVAQRMAGEIENDLFGPVRQELEAYWAKQKKMNPAKRAQTRAIEGGATNVLNLKKEQRAPSPPPMPGRGSNQ